MPNLTPCAGTTPGRLRAARTRRQAAIGDVRAALPNVTDAAARIVAFYRAHPERHADGARWYPEAGTIAEAVAARAPYGADGPGIVAALSPQTPWSENVALAFAIAEHASLTPCDAHGPTLADAHATGAACALAALGPAGMLGSVRACEAARGWPRGDTLGGPKVRAFRPALATYGAHPGVVVVDRHALALIYGRPLSERSAKILERVGAYPLASAAYRAAARTIGRTPCEVQAATWLAWRDVHSPGWAARDAILAQLAATPGPGAGF